MADFNLGDFLDVFGNDTDENKDNTDYFNVKELEEIFSTDFECTAQEIREKSEVDLELALAFEQTETSSPKCKRFKHATEEEINELKEKKQSNATKKATKWGVNIFQDWSNEVFGQKTDFSLITPEDLNNLLGKFYAEATPQVSESRLKSLKLDQASEYNKNSLKSIRSAINRHLKDINRNIDIVRDKHFRYANDVLDGKIKKNIENGLSLPTKHKEIIPQSDLQKINSYLYSQSTPIILRERIWYLLAIHFVSRGLEFHEQLRFDSFEFLFDENGDEYATLNHATKQKTWQGGLDARDGPKEKRMYAIPDSFNCPVKSLKKFLSKTNQNASYLFNCINKPALTSPEREEIWFTDTAIKKYQFSRFMQNITKNANCSKYYTAHCLRATAIQEMNNAGYELRHIMHMSGHRNESSIRSYSRDCTTNQKKKMSETLACLTGANNTNQLSSSSSQNSMNNATEFNANNINQLPGSSSQNSMYNATEFNANISKIISSAQGLLCNSTFNNCQFNFK